MLDEEVDPALPSEPTQPCNRSQKAKPGGPETGLEDFSSTAHPAGSVAPGLTLAQYAAAVALPLEFLRAVGLSDTSYGGLPAVRIAYFSRHGELLAVRFRIGLSGDSFRWRTGNSPMLYGLNRLAHAGAADGVTLVEGETLCHVLWHHGIPALGLPEGLKWRDDRDAACLDGIATIHVVVRPGPITETIKQWLASSSIRHRAYILHLPIDEIAARHLDDAASFRDWWKLAILGAVPWTSYEDKVQAELRFESWESCKDLASGRDILGAFVADLKEIGVVGESRSAKLLYLALTSRLLDLLASVVMKGPSSAGKSYVLDSVLRFFPPAAFYCLTAMSERALAYSNEPLKHRHLIIFEAAALTSGFATYLIRSLLSEGRVRYETVVKTRDGLVSKLIEREGPTGLILTTTDLQLHHENETRLLSLGE